MPGIVFLEAFGRFLAGGYPDEEDLYSVFRARSVLMGWYAPPHRSQSHQPGLWVMNEAELGAGDGEPRIGWAQVELRPGVPLAMALPALAQCLEGSLRRFGHVELSGYQGTAVGLGHGSIAHLGGLVSMLNCFGVASNVATVTLYGLGQDSGPRVTAALTKQNSGTFTFEAAVSACEWDAPPEMSSLHAADKPCVGLTVRLPEGPSAAGWVMAAVTNAALTLSPNRSDIRASLEYNRR